LEVGPCAAGTATDELGFELEGIRLGFGHRSILGGWNRNLYWIVPWGGGERQREFCCGRVRTAGGVI
jgi:hypothetical protein